MLRPDLQKWHQTVEDLRRLSLEADHPRSRERFQAVYLIATGQTNARQWAQKIDRCQQCVLGWVHDYNASGPTGLYYQHSGGRQPKLKAEEKKGLWPPLRKIHRRRINYLVTAGP